MDIQHSLYTQDAQGQERPNDHFLVVKTNTPPVGIEEKEQDSCVTSDSTEYQGSSFVIPPRFSLHTNEKSEKPSVFSLFFQQKEEKPEPRLEVFSFHADPFQQGERAEESQPFPSLLQAYEAIITQGKDDAIGVIGKDEGLRDVEGEELEEEGEEEGQQKDGENTQPLALSDFPQDHDDRTVYVHNVQSLYSLSVEHAQRQEETCYPLTQELSFTDEQWAILWKTYDCSLVFDKAHPLIQLWMSLITGQKVWIGAPLHEERVVDVEGGNIGYISCESGRKLVRFLSKDTTPYLSTSRAFTL